jgi:transposase
MSERELNRVEVLSQVSRGGMTAAIAAQVLGLSRRQVHRLLERFRSDGPAAIRHRARGRVSNRRIDPAVREFAMTLVRESYPDFGPTLAAEKLREDDGLTMPAQSEVSGGGTVTSVPLPCTVPCPASALTSASRRCPSDQVVTSTPLLIDTGLAA